MNRRELLRTTGTLVGSGAVLGGTAYMASNRATASISLDSQPQQATISGNTSTGEIDDIRVTVTGTVEWSNFEAGVTAVVVDLYARKPGNDWFGVNTQEISSPDGQSANISFENQSLSENTGIGLGAFEPSEPGETATNDLELRVETQVVSPTAEATASETHTVAVEVTHTGSEDDGNGNESDGNGDDGNSSAPPEASIRLSIGGEIVTDS